MTAPSTAGAASAPPVPHTGLPRSILAAGVGLVALVGLALIVGLVVPRGPTAYPAGSPEAAFQAYYDAWEARDLETALSHFSPAIRADLDLATYKRLDTEQSWQRDQDRRIVLLGVDLGDDVATLHVRVDEFYPGAFGGGRSSFERSVQMARTDGTWTIDEPLVGIEPAGYYK